MNLPTHVWLLRHAETRTPDVFHGAESDVDLSALGERQAEAFAAWMKVLQPDVVYSSAMLRARRTAEPIAQLCEVAHRIEPLLHERKVGILGGQPFDTISGLWADTLAAWKSGDTTHTTPGAECYDDIRERVLAGWYNVVTACPGQKVVIVAHGITCKVLLLSLLEGYGPTQWDRLGRVANTAVSLLMPDENRWHAEYLVRLVDDVAQLNNGVPTGLGVTPHAR